MSIDESAGGGAALPIALESIRSTIQGAAPGQLLDAWLTWRGPRLLPSRATANLDDIVRIRPWIGILDVLGPDDVRMRVAGTELRRVYGIEMSGRNVKEITAPEVWPRRSRRYVAMVTQPCGSLYLRRDHLPNGREVVYETLALPIDIDEAGLRRQMVFCVAALSDAMTLAAPAAPHRLPMPYRFAYVDIGGGTPT